MGNIMAGSPSIKSTKKKCPKISLLQKEHLNTRYPLYKMGSQPVYAMSLKNS